MKRLAIGLVVILGIVLAAYFLLEKGGASAAQLPPLIEIAKSGSPQAFKQAIEPESLVFPRDHGPHFDYQTEWWYFTGNLNSSSGGHFGFQLTFFRRGLTPGLEDRESDLASNQIYFAHFAVTDVEGDQHFEVERFSRGANLLAGARSEPYSIWLEDWTLESLPGDGTVWSLSASDSGFGLELELTSQKPPVLHGDHGLSQKSNDPGNASFYVSLPRLETEGRVAVDGDWLDVSGWTWFDHEWSTSALGEEAVGWDWFGLNLSDGRDLMLYQFRNEDGSIDRVSGGTLIEDDGTTFALAQDQIEISGVDQWVSPTTEAVYPSTWSISVPSRNIRLRVVPWILDQEMNISIIYWEGAVRIEGESEGSPVTGEGYVELTGYAQTLQGVF